MVNPALLVALGQRKPRPDRRCHLANATENRRLVITSTLSKMDFYLQKVIILKSNNILQWNLLDKGPESSSVSSINLVEKNLLQIRRYIIFPKALFLLASLKLQIAQASDEMPVLFIAMGKIIISAEAKRPRT